MPSHLTEPGLTRRDFLRNTGATVSGAALTALTPAVESAQALAAAAGKPAPNGRRVIVLGFDGLSPILAEKWMGEGKLPNFSALRERGGFGHLGTTNPAQTPVSWSSFATGMNPGKTNIYDFLRRDPDTYYPDFSMVTVKKAKFLLDLIPVQKAHVTNMRDGTSVWRYTSDAGLRTDVIHPPVAFPPEPVNGALLSGLGVPDLRGTLGTYSFYTTEAPSNADTEFGGKILQIRPVNGLVETVLHGPRSPVNDKSLDVVVPLVFRLERATAVTIQLQGQSERVPVGAWSRWFTVTFELTPFVSITGMTRFHVNSLTPEIQIYCSPVNFHPMKPVLPISYPKAFATKLAESIGYYKTLGWATDTWAFDEGRLPSSVFLEDLHYTLDKETQMFEYMLQRPSSLLIDVFMETDRAQHMFWRLIDPEHPAYNAAEAAQYGDSILHVYQKADAIVGKALAACDDHTDLFVISDHGFHSFRQALNTNTWLAKNGYLTLAGEPGRDRNLDDLFGRGQFWPNVDWSKTRAYALGLGQVYINLRGREREGIVSPGEDYEGVRNELIERLADIRDAKGARVVRRVYRREEIYSGEHFTEMPDLVLGLESGFRVSWQTSLGGIPKDVLEDNDRFWSADHCSVDPEITAGCIFSNQKLDLTGAHMIDMAPTILSRLGLPVPGDMDGRPLI